MSLRAVLIVGASAAGISAARTLREQGFDGEVEIVDSDPTLPYERPPLSKAAICGPALAADDIPLITESEASALRLRLRLGRRVAELRPRQRGVELAQGGAIEADAVLLATGARALRPRVPGVDLEAVHTLRTYSDAQAIREAVGDAETVAVIGGGLIGAEVAATLAGRGLRVVWIDMTPAPLSHIFPAPLADHLARLQRERGVEVHAGARVKGLLSGGARVDGVELENGLRFRVEAVVLGTGCAADVALARGAGLTVSTGVQVDHNQQTSIAGIYAAGDVAAIYDPTTGLSACEQHWRAAQQQGARAAFGMLGRSTPPGGPSWFWSDQGAEHVEMVGRLTGDSIVRRTSAGLAVFEMQGDRLAGVAAAGSIEPVRAGRRLIERGAAVDRRQLADPCVTLRDLLNGREAG